MDTKIKRYQSKGKDLVPNPEIGKRRTFWRLQTCWKWNQRTAN